MVCWLRTSALAWQFFIKREWAQKIKWAQTKPVEFWLHLSCRFEWTISERPITELPNYAVRKFAIKGHPGGIVLGKYVSSWVATRVNLLWSFWCFGAHGVRGRRLKLHCMWELPRGLAVTYITRRRLRGRWNDLKFWVLRIAVIIRLLRCNDDRSSSFWHRVDLTFERPWRWQI